MEGSYFLHQSQLLMSVHFEKKIVSRGPPHCWCLSFGFFAPLAFTISKAKAFAFEKCPKTVECACFLSSEQSPMGWRVRSRTRTRTRAPAKTCFWSPPTHGLRGPGYKMHIPTHRLEKTRSSYLGNCTCAGNKKLDTFCALIA